MRKEVTALVCALGLVGSATAAMAGSYGKAPEAEEMPAAPPARHEVEVAEEVDYARVGPYLGVGGVYAIELFDDQATRVDNSSGLHVRGGYRFHPNFAVEGLYEWYNEFDTDRGHYDGWSLTANAKAYALTGRFQPYAVIGLGYLKINGSGGNPPAAPSGPPHFAAAAGDGFEMRFGAGMDACITEHWALGPEVAYVLPFNDAEDLDFVEVSLGVRYKF